MSLLEHQETSVPNSIPVSYRAHLERNAKVDISAYRQLYLDIDEIEYTNRVLKFDDCRIRAWFAFDTETHMVNVMSNSCKLRWCPLCAQSRRANIAAQTSAWLKTQVRPKFLTLTIRHTEQPLAEQVSHLYQAFRLLRRKRLFTKNIRGGIWFFQIKQNTHDLTWHPHIHCLITGNYVPQKAISTLWSKLTRGSNVVDIRGVHDEEKAVNEVARYAAVPCDLEQVVPADRVELFNALHSLRTSGTWGSARGIRLRCRRPDDDGDWKTVASWGFMRRLTGGNQLRRILVKAWTTGQPITNESDLLFLQLFMAPPPGTLARSPPDDPDQLSIDNWRSN